MVSDNSHQDLRCLLLDALLLICLNFTWVCSNDTAFVLAHHQSSSGSLKECIKPACYKDKDIIFYFEENIDYEKKSQPDICDIYPKKFAYIGLKFAYIFNNIIIFSPAMARKFH